jgi:gas vesicle protein
MDSGHGNAERTTTSGYYDGADSAGTSTAFFTGLLAGVMIGSSLGLLFAPRKGSELREQAADCATSVGKAVSKTVDELADRGREVYTRARDVVSHAGDEIDRVAADAKKKFDKGLAVAADTAATKSRRIESYAGDRI